MDWTAHFQHEARVRAAAPAPAYDQVRPLHGTLVRSLQRFQTGEDGDGASLIAKTGGDLATRLFIAEEQNHARMLESLLVSAGATTIGGHWSDHVFVHIRRMFGLRLELMALMTAEVVALRYYEAVRDGTDDPVVRDVGGRILADEQRHVPFHIDRLHTLCKSFTPIRRHAATALWWFLLLGALTVVLLDHGAALRMLGVTRRRFAADTIGTFHRVICQVHGAERTGFGTSRSADRQWSRAAMSSAQRR